MKICLPCLDTGDKMLIIKKMLMLIMIKIIMVIVKGLI